MLRRAVIVCSASKLGCAEPSSGASGYPSFAPPGRLGQCRGGAIRRDLISGDTWIWDWADAPRW
jgi:hypothetical protein